MYLIFPLKSRHAKWFDGTIEKIVNLIRLKINKYFNEEEHFQGSDGRY